MKNYTVSQDLLIREMDVNELVEYAATLKPGTADYQKLIRKCIASYWQLTGKNLLNKLNELNTQNA